MNYSVEYWKKSMTGITTNSTFAEWCLLFMIRGKKLLDIGCGNGRDTRYFVDKGFQVHALDIRRIESDNFHFKEMDLSLFPSRFSYEEGNNIPFFLLFGTLLGAYRDKNFIAHDEDVDIGVFEYDRERIIQLVDRGAFIVHGMQYRTNETQLFHTIEYKDQFLDIFFYSKHRSHYVCGKSTIQRFQIDSGFSKIKFLNHKFNTVHDIEEYLNRHYGNDWRIPKKGKHARF